METSKASFEDADSGAHWLTGNDQLWSLSESDIHKDECHREWYREVEGTFGELPSWSSCPWQMASETWAADVYDCLLPKQEGTSSCFPLPVLLSSSPHPVYFGLQSGAVQHPSKAKERLRHKYQKKGHSENNPQIIISIINNKLQHLNNLPLSPRSSFLFISHFISPSLLPSKRY